jgi:hypothetical protein
MLSASKIQADLWAYAFALILVFALLSRYARQAIAWVLMRLYEVFIGRGG